MAEQEPSNKHPSRSKASPRARPAAKSTSRTAPGGAAKTRAAASKARPGGTQRTGTGDDLAERIRQRAYEIWEREGRPEGREQAHWEQAERELATSRTARPQTIAR